MRRDFLIDVVLGCLCFCLFISHAVLHERGDFVSPIFRCNICRYFIRVCRFILRKVKHGFRNRSALDKRVFCFENIVDKRMVRSCAVMCEFMNGNGSCDSRVIQIRGNIHSLCFGVVVSVHFGWAAHVIVFNVHDLHTGYAVLLQSFRQRVRIGFHPCGVTVADRADDVPQAIDARLLFFIGNGCIHSHAVLRLDYSVYSVLIAPVLADQFVCGSIDVLVYAEKTNVFHGCFADGISLFRERFLLFGRFRRIFSRFCGSVPFCRCCFSFLRIDVSVGFCGGTRLLYFFLVVAELSGGFCVCGIVGSVLFDGFFVTRVNRLLILCLCVITLA